METITATIDRDAKRVAFAAATDQARPVLGCVRIADNKIQAADGYIMAESVIKTEGGGSVLIDAALLKKIKVNKYTGSIAANFNGDVTLTGDMVITTEPQPGTFPNVSQLYPKGDVVLKIAFGGKKLAQLAKIVGDNLVTLEFYGKSSPVKFTSGDITGLLMPCFIK